MMTGEVMVEEGGGGVREGEREMGKRAAWVKGKEGGERERRRRREGRRKREEGKGGEKRGGGGGGFRQEEMKMWKMSS